MALVDAYDALASKRIYKFQLSHEEGASMERSRYGKEEKWGWEIDHDTPVSRGGTDDQSNLKPPQWENNTDKGSELAVILSNFL